MRLPMHVHFPGLCSLTFHTPAHQAIRRKKHAKPENFADCGAVASALGSANNTEADIERCEAAWAKALRGIFALESTDTSYARPGII